MGCSGCGTKKPRHNPYDKRGNSLSKYAFLNPNQIAIKNALEEKEKQDKEGK